MEIPPRRLPLSLKALTLSAQVALWLLALVALGLAAAWLTLQLWIVPRIGEWREQLEARATHALGMPVLIGAIEAHGNAWLPSFELQDVQLHDGQGRPALQLPRVDVTLSPRSLWRLGFEQVVIDQPELEVRRAADGRIFVAGVEMRQNQGGDGAVADWVLSQTEWVIQNGRVRWSDERRDVAPLELRQVDLRMHNGARAHELRLDATPPEELGSRFSLRGRLRQPLLNGDEGLWRQWYGQLYAVFERVDVAQLRQHVSLPLDVSRGVGALRAWVDVDQGRVVGATADVSLRDVAVKPASDLAVLQLQRLRGRLAGRALGEDGLELSSKGLAFETSEGLSWEHGDFRVGYVGAAAPAQTRGEVGVTAVDLAKLAALAQRLPLAPPVRDALQRYAPKGQIDQLQAHWQGEWSAPVQYDAKGRLRQLEVAAQEQEPGAYGSPGVRGLDVDFDLTQDGGRAGVTVRQGHLDLPGLFEQPRIALEQLTATVQWKQQAQHFSLAIPSLRFANADAQGEMQLRWSVADAPGAEALPGVLDLQGSLGRADVAAIHRYLPQVIPIEVRDYLRYALVRGQGENVHFKVKGNLRDFPFAAAGPGEFHITAHVRDAQFKYIPAQLQLAGDAVWPALTALQGDFVMDRDVLQLRNVIARLEQTETVRLSRGEARITDLGHGSHLETTAQVDGPLNDLLRGLVRASPLDAMLGGLFAQAQADGSVDAQFRLQTPLLHAKDSTVAGQVRLAGNDLQLDPHLPRLTRLRGTVHFSESGFALAGVQARLLGGDVRADGGTQPVPGVSAEAPPRLRVRGNFTAAGLRQESQLGVIARLAQQMSGGASYTAEFGMPRGAPELLFNTTLQGLAMDLPAPLHKPAAVALPLRVQTQVSDGANPRGAEPALDFVRVDLGRLAALRYVRDIASHPARVLRGTVAVGLPAGESAPMPESGVTGHVVFDEIDLDAWRKAAAPAAGAEPAKTADMPEQLLDYLPTRATVRGKAAVLAGQKFQDIVAGASRDGADWRINMETRELSGYGEYRASTSAGAGSVYARLARLALAPEGASGVETVLDQQPTSIPALDVVINSLELRGKNLGRVQIEAQNRGLAQRDAGAREWRLTKLTLSMPEADFSASGNWAVFQEMSEAPARPRAGRSPANTPQPAERRRTVMNFRLDLRDAGGLLTRLGMPGLLRAGKGRMEGQASWLGSPMTVDYASLGGQFNLDVETGQFLKADPGLAKLVGVLSLQALPRRLVLDFRDVFSEGFAFDFVRGDVQVEQGVARTNNLQMKGVNAAVLMEGSTDLASETQELRVVVVPEINAGTASLIAGVINPAVGLGTFLAQLILRGPVIASATQEFRVSGSWSEPQIVKQEAPPRPAPSPSPAPGESQ